MDEASLRAELGVAAGWLQALPAELFRPGRGFCFRFVGVLGAGRGLLVVLPKYLRFRSAAEWQAPATSYAAETRLLVQVLHRFQQLTDSQLPTPADEADGPENLATGEPAVALALVADYQTHGYWHQPQTELTTWEGARPDWPRTVARAQPLFTESGPLYPVRYGYRQPLGAAASLLEQLHRWAVRHCLETYHAVLPGFAEIGYDPEAADDLTDLGEPDYLRQVVDRALQTAFRDSHLHTLRLLRHLLDAASAAPDDTAVSLFGTTKFYRVWEVACQAVFANRSAEVQARLPVPSWHSATGARYQNFLNRLIPDVVWYDDHTLLIADAKYYAVSFGPNSQVEGGPGTPDLTKQVLYEQALVPLLQAANQSPRRVVNAFIIPTARPPRPKETLADWAWGHIQTNIPGWEGRNLSVWFIPPAYLFQAYLDARPLPWNTAHK